MASARACNIAGWINSAENIVTSRMDFYVAQVGFTIRRIRSVATLHGSQDREHHYDGLDWSRYGAPVNFALPKACRR